MMLSVFLSFWMVFADDCTIIPGELQPNGKPCAAQCCRGKGNCMYNFDTDECLDAGVDPNNCLFDDEGNTCLETCCLGKPAPCYFDGPVRLCRSPQPGPDPTPSPDLTCHLEEYLPKTTETCGMPDGSPGNDFWAVELCTGSVDCFKQCPEKCLEEPMCNYMNRADRGCVMFEECEGTSTTTNAARTFKKECTTPGPGPDPCPCAKALGDEIADLKDEIKELKRALENCPSDPPTMPPM